MSDHAIRDADRVSELALSIAWHAGLTRAVETIDGDTWTIVFPGHWTHGQGPDFRDAMFESPGGHLVTGAVEIHHRASDWERHGHHLDPAYNDVVLHAVTEADLTETRRLDGRVVPVAMLRVPEQHLRAVASHRPDLWDRFGGDVCAPEMATEQPERVRALLRELGDQRFEQRVVRFEGELALHTPAGVLVTDFFEAFGYSQNRDQMRRLAAALDWHGFAHRLHRRERSDRIELTLAVLLGLGGWMPLSPQHASLARLSPERVATLESIWTSEEAAWRHAMLPRDIWTTARVRPANHPVARVATLATLLGGSGGELLPLLLEAIRFGRAVEQVLLEIADAPETPPLGRDRAIAITASVVLPLAVAWARASRDDALEDAALAAWAALPAGTLAQPARRARQQIAGEARITGLRERGNQGLLHLDRHYCGPRRCYECPIARAVVADALRQPSSSM